MLHQQHKCQIHREFICRDQARLFLARVVISSSVIDCSPCSRLPAGRGEMFTKAMKDRRRRRSGSIRKTCPAKRSLRLMIVEIRSKSGCDAVSLTSFLVMVERQRLLKPLMDFFMPSVRLHASHPWVNAEHTPAMYSLIFIFVESRWSDHMWKRELNIDWAMPILYSTSAFSLPSHCTLLPRYSKE